MWFQVYLVGQFLNVRGVQLAGGLRLLVLFDDDVVGGGDCALVNTHGDEVEVLEAVAGDRVVNHRPRRRILVQILA